MPSPMKTTLYDAHLIPVGIQRIQWTSTDSSGILVESSGVQCITEVIAIVMYVYPYLYICVLDSSGSQKTLAILLSFLICITKCRDYVSTLCHSSRIQWNPINSKELYTWSMIYVLCKHYASRFQWIPVSSISDYSWLYTLMLFKCYSRLGKDSSGFL